MAVHDNLIVYVEAAETGRKAWYTLAEVYPNKGTANKMDMEEQNTTKKLRDGESAKEHIEELKRLKTKVQQLGLQKPK